MIEQEGPDKNSTIDGTIQASPQSQGDNPLLERLTPSQFNASVHFYEADLKLTPEDRNEIANDLKSVMLYSTILGYSSGIGVLLLPTIYSKVQKIPRPVISRPGMPPFTPRIYKPFLSFMMGLSALLVVNQQVAKYKFQQKINETSANYSKENQLQTWKAMDYHQSGMFYLYYMKTSQDPSFIIPDPRTVTKAKLHEVQYHPPKKTKKHGEDDYYPNDTLDHTTQSHWDKIRSQNGFTKPEVNDSSILDVDIDGLNDDDKKVLEKPRSAWDNVRKGLR